MPTKTKAQLETELKKLQTERDEAVKGLKEFKERVPKVMQEKIEQYDLDLCDDGVQDFADTLGIEWTTILDGSLSIYLSKIKMKSKRGRWGVEFDEDATGKFEEQIRELLTPLMEQYGAGRRDIDFDCWENYD